MLKTNKAFIACRRAVSLVLSVIMLISVAVPATAASVAMSSISVQWANPQKLRKINKTEKEAILTANINGTATNMYISFPTEGGIRFRTDNKGYFEPKSLKSIDYYAMKDGTMLIDAGDVAVKLQYAEYPWYMEFIGSDGKVAHKVSARQMYFGFKKGEMRKVKIAGEVSSDEMIYGLGGRYDGVNHIGSKVRLWNSDCWSATNEAYVNVPIINSTKGYSLFFSSYYGGYADIAQSKEDEWSMDFNGIDFDFFVYTETPAENTVAYTNLTGKPFTAPEWSFGYWAGNTGGYWGNGGNEATPEYKQKITDMLTKYKEMGTMPTAIYLEGTKTSNVDALKIADSFGVKTLGWQPPHSTLSPTYGNSIESMKALLPEVDEWELPAPHNYDNTALGIAYWGDWSNPNMQTFRERSTYNTLLAAGLAGSMIDFGEYIEENLSFYNGMKGDEMHNFNAYVFTKTFHDIFKKGRGNDFVLFARAGCAGSQQFAGNFGGDQQATFDGLRKAYYNGISLNASGFSNWGSDIGSLAGDPTAQLYQRWLQLGTFSPFMRNHGGTVRDPWAFEQIGINTFKQLYWLRNAIKDHLYGMNLYAGKTGIPMMQTMAYAFPEQKKLALVEDQYMLAGELLVAPVLDENINYINVTLPEGKWTDLFTGKTYKGGNTRMFATPMNVIPVFLRDGAVIKATVGADFTMFGEQNTAKYEAIVAAPSTEKRTATHYTDSKEYKFTNKPVGEDGFTVTNDSKHSAKIVIAAGVTAAGVKVNGKAVNKLDSKPANDSAVGYYVDYENRQTTVFTGGNWTEVSVSDSNLTYKNIISDATVLGKDEILTAQVESIADNDPTSIWMVHATSDGLATVDLGEAKSLVKVVVNWSTYYPESYKLEASADGNTWKSLNNNVALGGAETYDLGKEKVQYLRISEIVKNEGQMASPGLCDIEVYSDELVEEILEEEAAEDEIIGDDPEEDHTDTEITEDEPEDTEDDGDEGTDEVVKKRRKKKVVVMGGEWDYITIGLIVAGCVLAVAAAVVIILIVVKKKKKKA